MRWTLKTKPNTKIVTKLATSLGISSVLATILAQRGISNFNDAKKFFRPSLSDLHNPFLMKDMDIAVSRIETAIATNEKILIYGDYDVDGTTAVSVVASYLKKYHPYSTTYIPDRYQEGYGISYQGIDFAQKHNITLIIALDCGIKAINKIAYANEKKIDFIICDHHKPGKELPNAVAILNPKQIDCTYPYKELCGCGVGFKLIQALGTKRNQTIKDFIPYLDLVATAIAADIVPITGENRILTYYGLQVINKNPRNGIKAITHQLKKEVITITDVVFTIAPRINAAGRIQHGNYAVSLLTEVDFDTAIKIAKDIETFNTERKILDQQTTKEALLQIQENKAENQFTNVVFNANWHKGVIGIVASRLIETYYKPTVVFTKSGAMLAASARSVKGFDIYHALEACSEFIEQFGGHKYAAGLTIKPENYQKFKNKFEKVVSKTIDKKLLSPEILIDVEIPFSEITPKFFRIIDQLAPFGPQNMKPVFKSVAVSDTGWAKTVGKDKNHLKINLFQENNKETFGAIGFNLGEKLARVHDSFDVAYTLDKNTWNNTTRIQLVLKDLQ